MAHAAVHDPAGAPVPQVNEISLEQPWEWISKGWEDMRRVPKFSLAYGLVFFAISLLLTLGLFSEGLFFIVPPLAAGFFLVAPMLGIGLYQISQNLDEGRPVQFCQALSAWRRNEVHLSAMAVVLVLVMLAWMLAALLVFALFYHNPMPTWENFISEVFLSGENNTFIAAGIITGGVIAVFVYSISAVTVPMLMDRQVDVMTAMRTSIEAVKRNWKPMALWAALIVMFVGLGIMTYYVGLIVAMPLVGHATWHAYKDLVPAQ
jgi:uncharacterized membrane protein